MSKDKQTFEYQFPDKLLAGDKVRVLLVWYEVVRIIKKTAFSTEIEVARRKETLQLDNRLKYRFKPRD